MESGGDGGTEGGVVDASVGTIVWVRRRNGSWWPGRILGPGELAESHLLSPRSGTPVKLLGREDASVDWYNLEKSKRVKAFRCGEFDACIERAEAAQGVPIKKREKYARREDAILHALELERKNLQTTGEKPNSSSQSQPTKEALGGFVPKISKKPEVSHRYKSKKQVPEQEIDELIDLKKPFEDRAYGDSPVKKDRRRPLLKDLENSTDSPLSIPVPVADPYDSYQPGMSHAFDTGAVLLRGTVPVQGSLMGGSPVYRAKRTQCVYLPYQSEEDNAHVKIENMDLDFLQEPLPLDEDFDSYGMFDNNEPKSEIGPVQELDIRSERKSETETETESRASGSSEETDTDMEEPNELLIDTKQAVNQEPDVQSLPYRSAFHDSENYIREMEALPYNDICTGTGTSFLQDDSQDETGVSKWNMKGKRNNRNGTNKKGNSSGTNQGFYQPKEEFDEEMHLPLSWDGYYENAPLESMLVDVDLTVQASYQGERVPLVSLMSRLNGKAIVGYPLQIEILEEGSSSMFLPCTSSGTDSCPDGSSGLPPVWRTGRRTVKQRIVRPNTLYRSMVADQIHHTKKKKKKKKKTKKATSKSHKKSTKWKTKTKAISSLGGGDNLGGFVKKDGVVPVLPVTCVPVKVAFSRILEAVGRPCSHRARMPSLTVRDPP